MCRDIFFFSTLSTPRFFTYCLVYSSPEIHVPRKSAPKETITSALSKRYVGTTALSKLFLFALMIAEEDTASYVICFAAGYFAIKSAITDFAEGLMIVDEMILIFPPAAAIDVRLSITNLSTDSHEASDPLSIGV
jgi:hypothetical protein